jgi:hypothetical protein
MTRYDPLDLFAERHKRIARRRVAHGRLPPERLLRLLQWSIGSGSTVTAAPCVRCTCTDTMGNVGCHAIRSVAPLLHPTCHLAQSRLRRRDRWFVCLFVCLRKCFRHVRAHAACDRGSSKRYVQLDRAGHLRVAQPRQLLQPVRGDRGKANQRYCEVGLSSAHERPSSTSLASLGLIAALRIRLQQL